MPGNSKGTGEIEGREQRPDRPWRRSDITVSDERIVKRAVKAAALGNAMEWFDFATYSYLAIVMGEVFFNGSTIGSLATFALSFLPRPLGGLVFGPLGDRIGRKQVLATTMLLMAASTFCVGLIPSMDTIGVAAPALLVFFRLLQGFSTGGEYGGAATFIAEYAPDKRRGFYGSFLEMGTLAGYVGAASIAAVLQTFLSHADLVSWGWRIPFLIGGPIGLIGIYLRLKLDETPAFLQKAAESGGEQEASKPRLSENSPKQSLARMFRTQWPAIILCLALVAAYNLTDYMLLTYMPTYLQSSLKYEANTATILSVVTMLIMMCVLTSVGRLNDRHGRKPLLLTGMTGFLVLTIPAFLLLQKGTESLAYPLIGMLMLSASLVCLLGTMSAVLPAMFSTDVRYGALAISYNVSTLLFGGTTPMLLESVVEKTDNSMVPAYATVGAAVIGIVAVLRMKETAQQSLLGSPPCVATEKEADELCAAVPPARPAQAT
ncbi:MFS transporter [Streptomyces nanshensis]|uniref:Putative proline/betaine transporter n=1 Tax=Streptomyces nanshensis TaxID=518642 RepID=A0A1E7L6N3_9ACTN|nr:MFS transporter [Streptomyces nanshensis]OEV11856.1 MFS transporter [Streptomyces nanshensis]